MSESGGVHKSGTHRQQMSLGFTLGRVAAGLGGHAALRTKELALLFGTKSDLHHLLALWWRQLD